MKHLKHWRSQKVDNEWSNNACYFHLAIHWGTIECSKEDACATNHKRCIFSVFGKFNFFALDMNCSPKDDLKKITPTYEMKFAMSSFYSNLNISKISKIEYLIEIWTLDLWSRSTDFFNNRMIRKFGLYLDVLHYNIYQWWNF